MKKCTEQNTENFKRFFSIDDLKTFFIKTVFFILLFFYCGTVFAQEKRERHSTVDITCSTTLSRLKLNELVFAYREIISDLVWRHPCAASMNLGLTVKLKQGFSLCAAVKFFPTEQKMFLTDSDFSDGFRWSYSEHPTVLHDSFLVHAALGWRFFIKDFQTKKTLNSLYIEPAVVCIFHALHFEAADGYQESFPNYKEHKDKTTKQIRYFNGPAISYQLQFFSTQAVLNFYGHIGTDLEIKSGFGFGVYSKALSLDHHIERREKFYDMFNFYVFLFSANAQLQYFIGRGFGVFVGSDFLYSSSTYGETIHYAYTKELINELPHGSSGIRYMRFDFNFGMVFRLFSW